MVSQMIRFTYENLSRLLEELAGSLDPDDPREKKRRRIIESATDLFIRHGYRKTSVEDVARWAGVAKGTVYLYFGSKAEILLQAIVEEKKRYIERLKPILAPEVPPKDRLKKWIELAFVLLPQMPLLSKLMSGDRELLMVLEELYSMIDHDVIEIPHGFIAQMVDEAAAPHELSKTEIEDRAKVIYGLVYCASLTAEDKVRSGLPLKRFAAILADIIARGTSASNAGAGSSNTTRGET
jgi:AcrR family transcriptional regulator